MKQLNLIIVISLLLVACSNCNTEYKAVAKVMVNDGYGLNFLNAENKSSYSKQEAKTLLTSEKIITEALKRKKQFSNG